MEFCAMFIGDSSQVFKKKIQMGMAEKAVSMTCYTAHIPISACKISL
jgi:hypothetical protein